MPPMIFMVDWRTEGAPRSGEEIGRLRRRRGSKSHSSTTKVSGSTHP